jgi:hypothetical protein
VTVEVTQRNEGFHGMLTLSGKIDAPTGAPSPTDLAAALSIEPAEVSQVFFAGVGVPFCFAHLSSNEVVDRAAINRAVWAATLSRAWGPHVFFFAGNLRDGGELYARMCAPALGVEEDPATGSACAALVGAMASKPDFGGMAYRLSIQQGVSMGRSSDIEAEARKRDGVVTSVSVGGATTYIASGEIDVPSFALERPRRGHRPAISAGEIMLRNLFSATILAGPLAGSAMAQAPDAGCELPSEPKGIPAGLVAAITGPADKDRACMKALLIPEARMKVVSLGADGAPTYTLQTLDA